MNLVAHFLELRACQTQISYVHYQQVVISAVSHELVTTLHKILGQNFRVNLYLLNIIFELWCINYLKLSGKSADCLIMRSTLKHREYSIIDFRG